MLKGEKKNQTQNRKEKNFKIKELEPNVSNLRNNYSQGNIYCQPLEFSLSLLLLYTEWHKKKEIETSAFWDE